MGWEKVVHYRIKNLPYLIKAAGSLLTPRLFGRLFSVHLSVAKAGSFIHPNWRSKTRTAIKLVIRLTFFLTHCADVFLTWDSHFTVTNPEKWLFWKVKRHFMQYFEFIGRYYCYNFYLKLTINAVEKYFLWFTRVYFPLFRDHFFVYKVT